MPSRALTISLLSVCSVFYGIQTLVWPIPYVSTHGGDFQIYYDCARAVLAGHSPYSVPGFANQTPLWLVLATPLAALSRTAARMTWFLLSNACLLASAWLMWQRLGRDRIAACAVAFVWTLAGTLTENVALGQLQPLLLLLVATAWYAIPRKPGWAATLLGLAAGLKLWPAVTLLAFARWHRRTFFTGVCVFAVSVLAAWALLYQLTGPPHVPNRPNYWLGTPAPLNYSLPATALRLSYLPRREQGVPADWTLGNTEALALPAWRLVLSAVTALAGLGLGAFVILRRMGNLDASAGTEPALGALVCLGLVCSPISWYHYQALQLPALAWLATTEWRRRNARGVAAALGATLLLTRAQMLWAIAQDSTAAAWWGLLVGAIVPVVSAWLFFRLLREIGRATEGFWAPPSPSSDREPE